MITERDLIRLPFTRDLAEAGLIYARRVLLNKHWPAGTQPYDSIRRATASGALNLGLRRYLASKGVSFAVQTPPPFLDPDRYDLRLGNRTCELKTYLISRPSDWKALESTPQMLLDAPALVPLDRHTTETIRADDAYVFGIVGAAVKKQAVEMRTTSVPREEFWMHCLPTAWRGVRGRAPLGPLTLKAETVDEMSVELAGLDHTGSSTEHIARLLGGQQLVLPNSFVAVSHLGVRKRPKGRVGIHLPARRLSHVIEPGDWHNVWLDGWGMLLLGWITREEFRTRARLIPAGRKVLQFERTRTKNLAVSVSDLKPISRIMGTE
jgi:hypothetical protein